MIFVDPTSRVRLAYKIVETRPNAESGPKRIEVENRELLNVGAARQPNSINPTERKQGQLRTAVNSYRNDTETDPAINVQAVTRLSVPVYPTVGVDLVLAH